VENPFARYNVPGDSGERQRYKAKPSEKLDGPMAYLIGYPGVIL
jgi:hypothetical protein